MGRKVDGFIVQLLMMAGLYFYFRGAFESNLLCVALAVLAGLLISRIFRMLLGRISGMKCFRLRGFRKRAGGILMQLACMDREAAQAKVQALLDRSYDESYTLYFSQDHPSLPLNRARIFEIWHTHAGSERLLICTTSRIDAETRLFAQSFASPRIAVVDADILVRLIAEAPQDFATPARPAKRASLRLAACRMVNRKNALRSLVLAASMFVMYLFSANIFYLAASMLLVFLALAAFHQRKKPAKLF